MIMLQIGIISAVMLALVLSIKIPFYLIQTVNGLLPVGNLKTLIWDV